MRAEERCERTELIVSQCAHCRPPEPKPAAPQPVGSAHHTNWTQEQHLRYKKQLNDESQKTAIHSGQSWTNRELDIATDPRYKIKEAAQLLGRSINAVTVARHNARYGRRS